MAIEKVVSSNGYNNGGSYVNPNSLKIPSTGQKLTSETNDLTAASGHYVERFNDPRYYSGDTSS
jgi:hypothetical protein